MGAHISVPMYQRSLAQRYRLEGQRCKACGAVSFPPKAVCPRCRASWDFEPVALSGRGRVYTYTVIAAGGAPPEFAEQALIQGAYPVAVIELAEGPRLMAQLVEVERDEVYIGQPVEAVFRRVYSEEGITRYGYKFRPALPAQA